MRLEHQVSLGASKLDARTSAPLKETGKQTSSNGRQSQLAIRSSSNQSESEDKEDLQLVRLRRRHVTSSSIDTPKDNGGFDVSPLSSAQQNDNVHHSQHNVIDFPSDEWGGISSEEHDGAVMLEAAMFGGIFEGSEYHFPHVPDQLMQTGLDGSGACYPRMMIILLRYKLTERRK